MTKLTEGEREKVSTESTGATGGLYTAIDNLREVMGRCFDGKPLDGELANWLGDAIDGYLTRQSQTLEEAFGLVFPRGGIPWWREEANRKRDAALRGLAETFFDGFGLAEQCQEIWTAATRYAGSAWRFDQNEEDMPSHYAGTQKEWLWQAFKSGAPMPIGQR